MESPRDGDVPLSTVVSTTNPTSNNSNDKQTTTTATNYHENEKDANDMLIPAMIPNTGGGQIPEEVNVYRNKKTLTQGLMDIALFSANANQLRYIFEHGSTSQAYFYIAASLIIISLVLQVGVGLLLLMSTQYNISVECQREMAYKYGNYVVMGIFLITVVNIFIAAFGGPAVLPTAVQ
ncbi:ninjurin-A-like isoform X2 [Planococcus citri]